LLSIAIGAYAVPAKQGDHGPGVFWSSVHQTPDAPNTQMRIVPVQAYIEDTGTRKGNGVFAAKPFAVGETVEVCPVVSFLDGSSELPRELKRVIFNWGYLTGNPGPQGLALGYGSMYNHSNPANMRYRADPASVTLHFIAVRPIATGEELTVNYNAHGGGAEWDDNAWFQRMGVEPLAEE